MCLPPSSTLVREILAYRHTIMQHTFAFLLSFEDSKLVSSFLLNGVRFADEKGRLSTQDVSSILREILI